MTSLPLRKAGAVFGLVEGLSTESLSALFPKQKIKSVDLSQLVEMGRQIGFLQKPAQPIAASIFVTKGGVLKTTLTLNLARVCALHGLRVAVVGLDMQGDITQSLGGPPTNEDQSLAEALASLNELRGLPDLFSGQSKLDDILLPTEIPTLFYIPETPELVAMDQSLMSRHRREYWLKEYVVEPLKQRGFDLILMDCSPNWNRLINNALVASDLLISPIESKINNFRNLRIFRALVSEFKSDMRINFEQIFVPTRLVPARRLSREIAEWYQRELPNCLRSSIRESVHGEEATALRLSIPEHAPTSPAAEEIRAVTAEIAEQMQFLREDARGKAWTRAARAAAAAEPVTWSSTSGVAVLEEA